MSYVFFTGSLINVWCCYENRINNNEFIMKINILVTISLIISTNISFAQKNELGTLAVDT
jgi:hypothetical protein